jgi:hypothetical protein
LDVANAEERAFHGRLTKRTDVTMTANGATVTFTRPVYVRVWSEQAEAKVSSTYVIQRGVNGGNGRNEHILHAAPGNMAFTVFNDSEGRDLLLKVRAASITYSYTRTDTPDTPAVTPPK